jgi:hypothetical protein
MQDINCKNCREFMALEPSRFLPKRFGWCRKREIYLTRQGKVWCENYAGKGEEK